MGISAQRGGGTRDVMTLKPSAGPVSVIGRLECANSPSGRAAGYEPEREMKRLSSIHIPLR